MIYNNPFTWYMYFVHGYCNQHKYSLGGGRGVGVGEMPLQYFSYLGVFFWLLSSSGTNKMQEYFQNNYLSGVRAEKKNCIL
jgi:hypothetical protein